MRDLTRRPDGDLECARHGMEFMVAHEVMILTRIYDSAEDEGRGGFITDDADPVGVVMWYCDACDDNVPEPDRSRPWSTFIGHASTVEVARKSDRTAELVGRRLGLWDG